MRETKTAGKVSRPPVSVWLIEDNHIFCNTVARALGSVRGIECTQHFPNAEDALDAMLAGGPPMSPNVAGSVLRMFSKMAQPWQHQGLTERENKILKLMTQRLIKKEIADKLAASFHTVDKHLRNIFNQLHVHTCTCAVANSI